MGRKDLGEDCDNYDLACERFQEEFQTAVNAEDVGVLLKLKYFAEDLHTVGRQKLQDALLDLNLISNHEELIERLRSKFTQSLQTGDFVDIYSEKEIKWFNSKVLETDIANDTIKVHYTGWQEKYDEYLIMSQKRICPAGSFVKPKRKPVRAQQAVQDRTPTEVTTTAEAETAGPDVTAQPPETAEVVDLPRRRRSAAAPTGDHQANSTAKKGESKEDKGEKEEKDRNDWVCTICGWFEAPDGSCLVCCDAFCKRSFHLGCMEGRMTAPIGDDKWYCDDCVIGQHLCFICNQRGVDYQDVHKCSYGHCGKYYHQACLESAAAAGHVLPTAFKTVKSKAVQVIIATPKPPQDSAPTSPAAGGKSAKKSKTAASSAPVGPEATLTAQATEAPAPRSTRGVRLDYKSLLSSNGAASPSLAASAPVPAPAASTTASPEIAAGRKRKADTKADSNASATDDHVFPDLPYQRLEVPQNCSFSIQKVARDNVATFKCPRHVCFNCFEFHGAVDSSDLNACLACPRAFHTNCILPGSRFNSMCVLCPLHPDTALPSHDVRLNPKVAGAKKAAPINEYTAFWDMLAVPDETPDPSDPLANHFKLQVHVKDAAEDVPQTFTKITRNDYDSYPEGKPLQTFVPEVACECTVDCGESCYNRILRIECCDTKIRGGGSERETGDRCICAVGAGCTNRALQNRKYAKTEPFREFQMGWGLRAKESISAGALVMEYVGEVIDYPEVHRRMEAQRLNTPQDKDFYIMELDNGMFVDGKFKGSTSRYINHSCDPNCELQRWVVKGYPRIGIFAVRDIAPGEALSYDYQFDTNEAETFRCYCGTDKCRGTMAPKKKKGVTLDAQGRPQTREERERLIAMGKVRQQAVSRENLIEAEWGRSYTGKYLPGDTIHEMRNGPLKSTLPVARQAGLLLVRTVRRGTNFLERSLLQQRGVARRQQQLQQGAKAGRGRSARTTATVGVGRGGASAVSSVASPARSARASTTGSTAATEGTDNVGMAIDGF